MEGANTPTSPTRAGPHTLLFYAPTSLLPAQASAIVWMGLGLLAAIWVTRRLGVPIWWVAFPPLGPRGVERQPAGDRAGRCWCSAGPSVGSLAMGLKLYAGVVLLAKPRVLLVAVIVPAGDPAAPALADVRRRRLRLQAPSLSPGWNGSAWRVPLLIPPTLLALWILRRKGAEWWAVPAVWPSIQYYYVSMAMPMVVRRPILAALIATRRPCWSRRSWSWAWL